MGGRYFASERRDVEMALQDLELAETIVPKLLERFSPHCSLAVPGTRVLDLGAAQGIYVTALKKLGYDAVGLEPFEPAIETSKQLSERTGVETEIHHGFGEDIPFADGEFDLVIADSVMEHVNNPEAVYRETHRVLRQGGGFYFSTTSALSWYQHEIKGFPFFPWYPERVRRGIMNWAMENRPSWVGHTPTPAMHWFTPWGVRRDLAAVGYSRVIERWDMVRAEQFGGWQGRALKTVRKSRPLRFVGEFVKPGSGFLAIK